MARYSIGSVAGLLPVSGRQLFWTGYYAIILVAWLVLYGMTLALPWQAVADLPSASFWDSLCLTASDASLPALVAMWALMSAAMMMPTFVPAVRVFGEIAAVKASDGASMASLVAGYVAVWLVFSAAAALLQALLGSLDILAPDGTSREPALTAGLLVGAGVYQLSLVKNACLSKCRHPLIYFMQHWRPGNLAAGAMGLRLGIYCVGCCWALMLLGFIGGTMNLIWMGAATLFMTFEKLPGVGQHVTRPAGTLLIAAGVGVFAHALGNG